MSILPVCQTAKTSATARLGAARQDSVIKSVKNAARR
jgi:hypothetical protein